MEETAQMSAKGAGRGGPCQPSTREAEAGRSWIGCQLGRHNETRLTTQNLIRNHWGQGTAGTCVTSDETSM